MTEPDPSAAPAPRPTRTLGRALRWFVGVFLIHCMLYAFWAAVVGPRHKATRSDELWYRAPEQLDVVFLGDSHPRSAIDPRLMGPRAVNLATGGEHYTKGYYRFKTLMERQPRQVRTLVIPLDPNGFTGWHADAFAPEFVWARYVDFLELGELRGDRWTYAKAWAKGNLFPYTGELRTLNQLRSKRFGFGEALASGRFDWYNPKTRARHAYEAAEVHFAGHSHLDPAQVQGFERLIDWAEGQGMTVVALSYPLTDAYLRALETEVGNPRKTVNDAVVSRLATDHPSVVHLDYTDFYRGQPDLFADPHHLNRRGRILFSREIRDQLVARDLLRPPRQGL